MKKVLAIIEDSSIIADLISKFLTDKLNCQVNIYPNAEIYISGTKEEELLLLDYYLDKDNPKAMNGLDLLDYLNKKNFNKSVILISGLAKNKLSGKLSNHKILNFIDKDSPEFWSKLESEVRKYFILN